jgi:hypothetical protein
MELKIIDPTAKTFNEAVGISPERAIVLSKSMDALIKSYGHTAVRTHDVFNDIAHFCNNSEELVYCSVVHVTWHARRGNYLA